MTHRLRDSLLYAGVYNGHLNVYDTRINNTDNNNSPIHIERVTPRFLEMDYQVNMSKENYQHRMQLLDRCSYEENCFHKLKIHKLIEETIKKNEKFY
jgi:hypothetical protein